MQIDGASDEIQPRTVLSQNSLGAKGGEWHILQGFALHEVAGDVTSAGSVAAIREQLRCQGSQLAVAVALLMQVGDKIVADGGTCGVGKRCLVEGDGLLVEHDAHQGSQAAAEAVAGEADGGTWIGGFDF
jgi:hypothetical protein